MGTITLSSAFSQTRAEHTIWLEASEKIAVSPQLSALLLFQNRQFPDRKNTYQNLYWANVDYRIRKVSLGGGIMFFEYHKRLESTYKSVPEVRPFQYVSYAGNTTHWNFHLRAMMEERYMSDVHENEVYNMNHLEIRFRFRTNATYSLNSMVSLRVGNEVFWNRETEFIQNRATAEFGVKLGEFKLFAGYMNWYLEELPIRHSWLLRIRHQIGLRD